ncbi:MAG TPA: hypothetical protein VNO21_15920 [Polyangiaceae bacterium]|nr:hypothetical protein [Polyangiaceae bacterium]
MASAAIAVLAGCSSDPSSNEATGTTTAAFTELSCSGPAADATSSPIDSQLCPTGIPVISNSADGNYTHRGCAHAFLTDIPQVTNGNTFWVQSLQPTGSGPYGGVLAQANCEHVHARYWVIGYDATGAAYNMPIVGAQYGSGQVPQTMFEFSGVYSVPPPGGFGGCQFQGPEQEYTMAGPEAQLTSARIVAQAFDDRDTTTFYPLSVWAAGTPNICPR